MNRLVLTSTATVAGIVALLSLKTQTQNSPILTTTAADTSGSSASSDSSSGSSSNGSATSSTYTGDAVTTRYGIIQVQVTVTNKKITDVSFAQLTAFDGHSQQINSWAGPELIQEAVQQQSAQVDTISGATYTSDGYRQSLQSALDQAGLT
ncbi:FMN-binding protein [Kineosporia sp. NBRC 101731]|uniref:FMN-binding protein n=1 Tax=Kineosporia sp. NBRC 101731 TaxID=3032199 RepID=UPI0024A0344A|nr:FMN-binding protein [Kineosporia sp. NBRC 101731]GLY33824.1 FMN-binding protein [Kineosporia sp. NBRC 101731]